MLDASQVWLMFPKVVKVWACSYVSHGSAEKAPLGEDEEDVSYFLPVAAQKETVLIRHREFLGEFPVIAASLTRESISVWVSVAGRLLGLHQAAPKPSFMFEVSEWQRVQ